MKLLANSAGQDLLSHGLATAMNAAHLASGCKGSQRGDVIYAAFFAGLFHDIGKATASSQKFYADTSLLAEMSAGDGVDVDKQSEKEPESFVYHNEVSWAIISWVLGQPSKNDRLGNITQIVRSAVYLHHPERSRRDLSEILNRLKQKDIKTVLDFLMLSLSRSESLVDAVTGADQVALKEFLALMIKATKKSALQLQDSAVAGEKPWDHESFDIRPPARLSENVSSFHKIRTQAQNILTLACLVEADRAVSSVSPEVLEESLTARRILCERSTVGQHVFSACESLSAEGLSERSALQMRLADAAAKHTTSICGAPPSLGKTRISLLHWARVGRLSDGSRRKLVMSLPRNLISESLYFDMTKSELRAVGIKASVSLVLGGHVVAHITADERVLSGEELAPVRPFDADITIINIDSVLGHFYKNGIADRLSVLFSCVFIGDEFHELVNAARGEPLLALFLSFMSVRHLVSGAPSLLISGTPLPIDRFWNVSQQSLLTRENVKSLCESQDGVGGGDDTYWTAIPSCVNDKTHEIEFKQYEDFMTYCGEQVRRAQAGEMTSSLITNAVLNAQIHHLLMATDTCLHSRYTETDKRRLLTRIYEKNGVGVSDGQEEPHTFSSAPITRASMNIGTPRLDRTLSNPWDDTQSVIGKLDRGQTSRSINRHKTKLKLMIMKKCPRERGAINVQCPAEVHKSWVVRVLDFYDKRPVTAEGRRTFTHDQWQRLYLDFITTEAGVATMIETAIRESFQAASEMVMRRSAAQKTDESPRVAGGSFLRGGSSVFITSKKMKIHSSKAKGITMSDCGQMLSELMTIDADVSDDVKTAAQVWASDDFAVIAKALQQASRAAGGLIRYPLGGRGFTKTYKSNGKALQLATSEGLPVPLSISEASFKTILKLIKRHKTSLSTRNIKGYAYGVAPSEVDDGVLGRRDDAGRDGGNDGLGIGLFDEASLFREVSKIMKRK